MVLSNFFNLKDNSLKLLLFANIATIAFAIYYNWGLATLLWGYWLQSIIIGFFNFWKLAVLVSRAKTQPGNSKKQGNMPTGIFLAFFFAFHYGFFHLVYLGFLSNAFGFSRNPDFAGVLSMGIIFFFTHGFSFWYNNFAVQQEKVTEKTMANAFIEPYARIIPMHFTILFCGFISAGLFFLGNFFIEKAILVFFLALKTLADLKGHDLIHKAKSAN